MDAQTALPNYFKILEGDLEPVYIRCKSVAVDVKLESSTEELWKEHEKKVRDLKAGRTGGSGLSLLDLKIELCKRMLNPCNLCERKCKVNRLNGEKGYCEVSESKVASRFIHWGEEPELIPSYTIFFTGCTFECLYCQNWDISQRDRGEVIRPRDLAFDIERKVGGVRNVNWVGGEPTPNLPYILEILRNCNASLPQIWNSNMYMTLEAMNLLDGIIDVYLADFKYGQGDCAKRLSRVMRYWEVVSRNHKIANEQCEIVLRHLVLPNHLDCCTKPVLQWIADNLDTTRIRVNVMDQYRPEYRAYEVPEISRKITNREFNEAWKFAEDLGLNLV